MDELSTLKNKANQIFLDNFPNEVSFERAVFFSWGCSINDCGFCYMSAQPKDKPLSETKRSFGSILAEFILCKQFGWDIGFFSGGIGVLKPDELEEMLKVITQVTGEKIWLNIGPLPRNLLSRFTPYVKGIVGSTETVNPILHKKVCPSKPLEPYFKMFEYAKELGLERAMTFIVGMGETKDDFKLLKEIIVKYGVTKIHVYSLIPHPGTMMENFAIPSKDEQSWWISKLRIEFPKLDIQCGIWHDRVEYISDLLQTGVNSISKFKCIELFGTEKARIVERQIASSGRKFNGSLTKIPNVDWDSEISRLDIDGKLKSEIKIKLDVYLKKMKDNCKKIKI